MEINNIYLILDKLFTIPTVLYLCILICFCFIFMVRHILWMYFAVFVVLFLWHVMYYGCILLCVCCFISMARHVLRMYFDVFVVLFVWHAVCFRLPQN